MEQKLLDNNESNKYGTLIVILVLLVFLIILRGKDIRVCVVAFAAVLSHLAFDIFLADVALGTGTNFPLFSPFTFETVSLQGLDWLGIQIVGVSLVAITSYFFKRKEMKLKNNLTKT